MEKVIWGDKHLVGIRVIDEQHHHFVDLLNKAYKAFYASTDQYRLMDLISQIFNYATEHFATEEKYFDQFHYKYAEEHKKEHEKLLAEILIFKERLGVEGAQIIIDLVDFLENWLNDHLMKHDKKYISYFQDHKLA